MSELTKLDKLRAVYAAKVEEVEDASWGYIEGKSVMEELAVIQRALIVELLEAILAGPTL